MPGGRLMPLGCIPRHRVALIVPFRARDQHLTYFVNHLYPFLRSQLLDFIIIVVEQVHNSQLTIPTIPATPVLMLSLRFCDRVTLGYIMIMVIVTSGPSTSNLTKRPHRRRTWTVQSYSPGCASVHSSITHSSLGSPESKTASRSVQPFLQGSLRWQTDRPGYSVCNNRPHLPLWHRQLDKKPTDYLIYSFKFRFASLYCLFLAFATLTLFYKLHLQTWPRQVKVIQWAK